MSRRLLIGAALTLAGAAAWGRNIAWKPAEKPPVSLERALSLAEAQVKKEGPEFYCLRASLAKTFSEGDWELEYGSPGGKLLWISVGSDQQVRLSRDGFRY